MKPRRSGLTMVEILVVVGIIALLTGLLIPAVSMVRKTAKEAKQKVQFTAIGLGLEAYKADFGDYPPSDCNSYTGDTPVANTAGALKLAEALLGWDLMGVHPDTGFRVDGKNRWPYQPVGASTPFVPGAYFLYDQTIPAEVNKRKGRYLEIDTANPYQLGIRPTMPNAHDGLFDLTKYPPYDAAVDCFVLCDAFGKGSTVLQSNGTRAKAGRPILYYRANPSYKYMTGKFDSTYNRLDNEGLLGVIELSDQSRMGMPRPGILAWNPLVMPNALTAAIKDPRVPTGPFPVAYRPDSYILISAGADGLYGTSDDIYNFGR